MKSRAESSPRHEFGVTLVGLFLAFVVVFSMLRGSGNDPLVFAALGYTDTETTPVIQEHLGRAGPVRAGVGHDGKYFLMQSWDPLYLDGQYTEAMDDPLYRARRMLFPLLLGAGGLLPDHLTPWSMAYGQVLILGLGTLGAAKVSQELGGSPWAGLAFVLNPGLWFEVVIGGAGVLALATAVWGTWNVQRGRLGQASIWLMLSVLTREVMLVYVAGLAVHHLLSKRKLPIALVAPSIGGLLVWDVYLRLRLEPGAVVSSYRIVTWPFGGIMAASRTWADNGTIDRWTIFGVIVLLGVFTASLPRLWKLAVISGPAAFLVLSVLLSELVWFHGFDISRAVSPVTTLLPIAVLPAARPVWARFRSGGGWRCAPGSP